MAEYRETYEVRGEEPDVAEWWREADRLAERHNVTLSEDFGNSELGDVIRAIKVLQRVSVSSGTGCESAYVSIEDKRLFDSIPGQTRTEIRNTEDGAYYRHVIEYGGIEFTYWEKAKAKAVELQVVA